MRTGKFATLLLAAFIAGCAQLKQNGYSAQAEAAYIENTKRQFCIDQGAQPGTEEYVKCRQHIAAQERGMLAQRAAAMPMEPSARDVGDAAMMSLGGDYISPSDVMIARQQGIPASYLMPQKTRCVTKPELFGNGIVTECSQ